MKKSTVALTTLFVVAAIVFSVWLLYNTFSTPTELNDLKRPVVVFAESEYGDIILKDSNSFFLSIPNWSATGEALTNTFNVGDTIR